MGLPSTTARPLPRARSFLTSTLSRTSTSVAISRRLWALGSSSTPASLPSSTSFTRAVANLLLTDITRARTHCVRCPFPPVFAPLTHLVHVLRLSRQAQLAFPYTQYTIRRVIEEGCGE